ncbi:MULTISPECIES: hypothetical protein [unclassified Massilia]|uniref:hypothetical protein n=1 Tax=unclassified Massilia TaxID=2609279 RepID=UPI0017849BA5|nr:MULTISPECIES: hypothetical protein [unclassified Massilia]MBD8533415.1 hypothetical protein [Massilia sp. CFBP 13647]MBD8676807.1 hypothetical protein [Massilia sp. CFBP 13721]
MALLIDGEESAHRTALVACYNRCVGAPKKITRTIQKQFVMGFMSEDEIASLRAMYLCVIAAAEAADASSRAGMQ